MQFYPRLNVEELKQEVMELNTQLRQFLSELAKAQPHIKESFEFFVQVNFLC